jgi:hypothetical protein
MIAFLESRLGLFSAGLLDVCAAQRMWPDWLGQDEVCGFDGLLEQCVRVTGMLLGDELIHVALGLTNTFPKWYGGKCLIKV